MDFLTELGAWIADPANWSGGRGIPNRLWEHLVLSALPLSVALAIALPVGLLIGHTGRGAVVAINLANIGRALPSLAIIVGILPFVWRAGLLDPDPGFWASVVALTVLAIPPVVTNTHAGVSGVDRDLVEAGRGMGMRDSQVLLRIELPLAAPVILAGIRTAATQVVATATLAAVIAGGGLGRFIIDGIARRDDAEVFAGALMVAMLAILTDLAFGALQRRVASPGMGRASEPERQPSGV